MLNLMYVSYYHIYLNVEFDVFRLPYLLKMFIVLHLGYRIYVNGVPKGMVAGTQTKSLLEGLDHKTLYKIHIRALSALGESAESNTIEVKARERDGSVGRSQQRRPSGDGEGPPDGSAGGGHSGKGTNKITNRRELNVKFE